MLDENRTVWMLLTGSIVKHAVLTFLASRKRKQLVGHVSRLHVFPLKSARELPDNITEVRLTDHGIVYNGVADRHWLVTKNGDMMTMKQSARLTLISPSIHGNHLHLDATGMATLILPLDPKVALDQTATVTVKNTPLPALDMGAEAAGWVCSVLQQEGLRLNFSAPSLDKRLSSKVHKDWGTLIAETDEIAFQDFGHCMIMCESSLADLNGRLPTPMSVIPFRPNVMIDGTHPYDEDNWREIYFGEQTSVRYVDQCTRCLITQIDHVTGEKFPDEQPLKELKTYRLMDPYGPKPVMGIHTVTKTPGYIRVGDPVYVVKKK
ncbi:mitochondrial amidoxime-reducing component 1-like [Dreissena polymorpha]|uniref:MOSC domain-containing protein n=1 Tax=Dreissena polymorpha TaxID=45954 RepID=A0A9D4BW91_DREPO|nr:mitochondrial amidoxime-reducing component 1-like [Dreissena polymorpha]KAH3711722.1 hypothetical protein DPMN_071394 [Dreissena polymorpha]